MSLSHLVLPPFSQACAPYTALEYLGLEADFDVHLGETLTALSSHPSHSFNQLGVAADHPVTHHCGGWREGDLWDLLVTSLALGQVGDPVSRTYR